MIGNLSRGCHTGEIVPTLNKACYVIRSVKPFISSEVLSMIYFSLVHSIISYGIFFGGVLHSIVKLYLRFKKE